MKKEIFITSTDNETSLRVSVWEPDDVAVRACVQISHGMIEYMDRYDRFARFLNSKGILVVGNDHLGHGYSVRDDSRLGYFGPGLSKTVVSDLNLVTGYIRDNYKENIPIILFGHSMGSFMARRYLMEYGENVSAAIICGTGYTSDGLLVMGDFASKLVGLFKGDMYRSELLRQIAFGAYNKRIDNLRTPNDWLTRDEKIVDAYNADKYCTYKFTVNGYKTLMDVLKFIQKKANYTKIPKKLPIFMIAGRQDPVGEYGKAVEKIFNTYKAMGVEDIELKLYDDDRHEILNELDYETVYSDVEKFINEHLER